jgi:predicted dehydrogenase
MPSVQPRVGLIGAGNIGRFHARSLRGVTRMGLVDAKYVAVCDRESDRAESFAQIAGLDFWTNDPDELIASPLINTVYVGVPTGEHKALVLKAAAAGKHIFCEKPLARTLADAREMYDAVRAAGVRHQVGLVLRHSPIILVLKDMMSDPKLGRPMAVCFRDDQFFPIQGHYMSSWRKDFALTGGGALIEHSIHDIDILTLLFGDITSVRAETRNFAGHQGVEDLGAVTMKFVNGATGQLMSLWHDIQSRGSGRSLEFFFERGYFAVDQDVFGDIRYETYATNGAAVMQDDDVRRRYLELMSLEGDEYAIALNKYTLEDYFFLRALSEERDPYPGFDVAVRAHELVDAVYRSAADGGNEVAITSGG